MNSGIAQEIVIQKLFTVCGQERVLLEPEDLIPYTFDGTAALREIPRCVVFPRTTAEVAMIMRVAAEHRVSVVARGSGTGLSGGSVPAPGCIVLCLVQMNRILELDEKNLTLLAETGVVTQTIAAAAEAAGLMYPPDPGSLRVSTIGGNVAENSGGLRGLKYGVTRDYVMALEVVLADGRIVWLGSKCVKDVAGYSMKDVFIGSEGTLGIITKVLLKLVPQPQSKKTLVATFASLDAAAETVSAIIANKIVPCTLEFLDKITIHCVEDFARIGLPRDAEALLLLESDGHPDAATYEACRMEQIARQHGAMSVILAGSPQEAARLATARRSAFSALARVSPTTILEDATVPRTELAKMVRFIQEVGERHAVRIATFGHMGDGNLHPTFLTDERNTAEMERVERAMKEIFDYAVHLGGTITGEHGVGLAKREFLPKAVGEDSLSLMRLLKQALDPHGLLNPGKIFAS
ncbi:MAG TPA: FAD-linked oxidase C-terminal domain-containing protein [Verrucomicrobiae bacterium]|jgi:glycolate oxidase|nr:FAD-linked oxidase C-terminal domain-containing protein [Verrucomicrobiae bacterium]